MAGLAGWSLAPAQGQGAAARRVVVEDFEHGTGHWVSSDDQSPAGPAKRCSLEAVTDAAPGGGKHAGRAVFARAASGWASLTVPVDGRKWAETGCNALSLWLRGDGSGQRVRIGLTVRQGNPEREQVYSQAIKLDGTAWEGVSLRLFGFCAPDQTPLAARDVQHIRALSISKNGTWEAFRFRMDSIQAEVEPGGMKVPAPDPPDASPVSISLPPSPDSGGVGRVIPLGPDFGRTPIPQKAQLGFSLGPLPTVLDRDDPDAAGWAFAAVSDMAPCVVRLELGSYYDARAGLYLIDTLVEHYRWVLRSNARPLVCLDAPVTVPGADENQRARRYAEYVVAVTEVVRRCRGQAGSRVYEVFANPLRPGGFDDVGHLVSAYNKITALVLQGDPGARVGGPGLSAAWDDQVAPFLKGARRLDFLSFRFHGTHTLTSDTDDVFGAALTTRAADLPRQLSFRQVAQLARTVRRQAVELYVTDCAPSSSHDTEGNARDERVQTGLGAAWLTASLLTGGVYVDKVVCTRLWGGGWGMLSESGTPGAPYWAAWLMRMSAPRGARRLDLLQPDGLTVAGAFQTAGSSNVVIAYGGSEPVRFQIAPKRMPAFGQVRYRLVSDAQSEWEGGDLPVAELQVVSLSGPGVVVVEYLR